MNVSSASRMMPRGPPIRLNPRHVIPNVSQYIESQQKKLPLVNTNTTQNAPAAGGRKRSCKRKRNRQRKTKKRRQFKN